MGFRRFFTTLPGAARAVALALLLPIACVVAFAAFNVTFTTYPSPPFPGSLAAGPDGAMWFSYSNGIARITTAGLITQYPLPKTPSGLTTGPDGAIWAVFAYYPVASIVRMNVSGSISTYDIPGFRPSGAIAAGPDNALWFTGTNDEVPRRGKVGRISTSGAVTEYLLPEATSSAGAITAGADGALWFTESSGIGRITTTGVITEYATPTSPSAITAGPDGAIWFTEANAIGRISTSGIVTRYPTTKRPDSIAIGPDGALWSGAYRGLIRITTAGETTEFPSSTAPEGLTAGPGGTMWCRVNCQSGGSACTIAQMILPVGDTTPPVSSVSSLGDSRFTHFRVQWSGTDAGSGIRDYTVYVSDNGGVYTPWLTRTSAAEGTYVGSSGHTYRFNSIARDWVGNEEGRKLDAEAETRVTGTVPLTIVLERGGDSMYVGKGPDEPIAVNTMGDTPLPGLKVTLTAPTSGPSGYFDSGTTQIQVTDHNGMILVSPLANMIGGNWILSVSAGGVTAYVHFYNHPGHSLNIQVSPPNSGSVSPSSGNVYPPYSVVPISATPAPGHTFLYWSSAPGFATWTVADPNSAVTTVRAEEYPGGIVANFSGGATTLAMSIAGKSGPQSARVWTFRFTNNGPGYAMALTLQGVSLSQSTYPPTCQPMRTSPTLPLVIGNVVPGGVVTANVIFNFTGCPANARFSVEAVYSANDWGAEGQLRLSNQFQ